jgi:cardiolipin synthase A/B
VKLKYRAIVVAVGKAAQRGVSCRFVLTANPAWTKVVDELATAGCSIHVIPADNRHLYMHEKMLLTDDTMRIIGS